MDSKEYSFLYMYQPDKWLSTRPDAFMFLSLVALTLPWSGKERNQVEAPMPKGWTSDKRYKLMKQLEKKNYLSIHQSGQGLPPVVGLEAKAPFDLRSKPDTRLWTKVYRVPGTSKFIEENPGAWLMLCCLWGSKARVTTEEGQTAFVSKFIVGENYGLSEWGKRQAKATLRKYSLITLNTLILDEKSGRNFGETFGETKKGVTLSGEGVYVSTISEPLRVGLRTASESADSFLIKELNPNPPLVPQTSLREFQEDGLGSLSFIQEENESDNEEQKTQDLDLDQVLPVTREMPEELVAILTSLYQARIENGSYAVNWKLENKKWAATYIPEFAEAYGEHLEQRLHKGFWTPDWDWLRAFADYARVAVEYSPQAALRESRIEEMRTFRCHLCYCAPETDPDEDDSDERMFKILAHDTRRLSTTCLVAVGLASCRMYRPGLYAKALGLASSRPDWDDCWTDLAESLAADPDAFFTTNERYANWQHRKQAALGRLEELEKNCGKTVDAVG